MENKSKKLLAIKAFTIAPERIELRYSNSSFSFDKTISPKPDTNTNIINSSAKLVLKAENIFVSINEENTANTGMVNRKSNQRYSIDNTIPVRISSIPANFHGNGNKKLFM